MGDNDHLELADLATRVLRDDGILDEDELNSLLDIVMRDGGIDETEQAILSNLFAQLPVDDLSPHVLDRVNMLKGTYKL